MPMRSRLAAALLLLGGVGCGEGAPAEPARRGPPGIEAPEGAAAASRSGPPPGEVPAAAPPPSPARPGGPRLVAGADFTCALDDAGQVRCWGSNRFGQLGDPALAVGVEASRAEARPVEGLPPAAALAAGAFHACALARDGRAHCWGHGAYGQLGDGASEDRRAPVEVRGLAGAVSLAAGHAHTCATRDDGTVWCWGSGERGRLGPDPSSAAEPRAVEGVEGARLVRAGHAHSCALRADGAVLCWGENVDGALGDGTLGEPAGFRGAPRPVGLPEGRPADALAAGGGSTCARLSDGELFCWGRDDSGQLGLGTGGHPARVERLPRSVPDARGARAISLGSRHACIVRPDATVACAGWNGRGQLGDGTEVSRARFGAVPGLADVVEVAAGARHTCARTAAGAIRCWGDDEREQLGVSGAE